MEEYLTLNEAGKLLKVNPKTIRNWIEQQKLPVLKLNRTIRVPRSAIEAFIQQPPPSGRAVRPNRDVFERLHQLRARLANREGVLTDLILNAREELENNGSGGR